MIEIGAQDEFTLVKPAEESEEGLGERSVLEIVRLLRENKLSKELINKLCAALPLELMQEDYSENFNLRDELSCQIQVVRGLRKEIFYANGALKPEYGVDDASRVLNASRDLLKLLQSQHEELVNYERIQAIETAFLDTIAGMPLQEQERYRDSLALYLEQHSPS